MRRSAFFFWGRKAPSTASCKVFFRHKNSIRKKRPAAAVFVSDECRAAAGGSRRSCVLAPPSCSCASVDAHRTVLCALCCVRCAVLRAGVSAAVSPFSGVVRARLAGARLFLRTRRGARRGVFVPEVGRGRQGKAKGVLRFSSGASGARTFCVQVVSFWSIG